MPHLPYKKLKKLKKLFNRVCNLKIGLIVLFITKRNFLWGFSKCKVCHA